VNADHADSVFRLGGERNERGERVAQVSLTPVGEARVKSCFGVERLFFLLGSISVGVFGLPVVLPVLLNFGEIFSRIFPIVLAQIKMAQLESGLRINSARVVVSVKTQSVLQVILALIFFLGLNTFDVSLKRLLRNSGGARNQGIEREGKRLFAVVQNLVALVENIVGEMALNLLELC
jgi:hypothetical protein